MHVQRSLAHVQVEPIDRSEHFELVATMLRELSVGRVSGPRWELYPGVDRPAKLWDPARLTSRSLGADDRYKRWMLAYSVKYSVPSDVSSCSVGMLLAHVVVRLTGH